jgi:hypothetical protein
VTLSQRHNPGSKLQIIPVMSPMALGQYKTWVPYNEPATLGMYEYQATADPMNAMGTNTAFLGSHDGDFLSSFLILLQYSLNLES